MGLYSFQVSDIIFMNLASYLRWRWLQRLAESARYLRNLECDMFRSTWGSLPLAVVWPCRLKYGIRSGLAWCCPSFTHATCRLITWLNAQSMTPEHLCFGWKLVGVTISPGDDCLLQTSQATSFWAIALGFSRKSRGMPYVWVVLACIVYPFDKYANLIFGYVLCTRFFVSFIFSILTSQIFDEFSSLHATLVPTLKVINILTPIVFLFIYLSEEKSAGEFP